MTKIRIGKFFSMEIDGMSNVGRSFLFFFLIFILCNLVFYAIGDAWKIVMHPLMILIIEVVIAFFCGVVAHAFWEEWRDREKNSNASH